MGHRLDRLGAAWRLLGDPAFRSLVRGSAPDTPSAPPEAQRAPSPGSRMEGGMAGRSGSKKCLKGNNVKVRVAPQERDLIERKARQANVTMSEFIRQAALGREVRSVADRKAMADLNRLGGLLKWWLTDGKGKDGERHIRGKAPPMHVPRINDLLRDIEHTILRVITTGNDSMDDDRFEDAEVDDIGGEDDR
jgi:hypothetical protein